MNEKPNKGQQVEIIVDDELAQGTYVNLAMVNHSRDEFTLDFIYVPPNSPKAKMRARLISSPGHTKRILIALTENIRRYEERFGTIEVGPQPVPGNIVPGSAGHA